MSKPNQKEKILEYIQDVYSENGYSPSLSEIAAHLNLKSKTNIHKQLQQLCADFQLVNSRGRYIPVSQDTDLKAAVAMVPLLGNVAAGTPITAVEDLQGYVAYLPRSGDGRELFALSVKGESMIDVGINDGDIVIVEKTPVVHNGEIAVALIDDEATVKRFFREDGRFRLQPENKTMSPIIVEDVTILGRVVSSMRYY